jgi:fructose-1,6-bisphosphatase I
MGVQSVTLTRHAQTRRGTLVPPADLGLICERVGLIAKRMSRQLAHASIGGELGMSGAINLHGEMVKKLDVWSNDVFLDAFEEGFPVCSLISEEMEQAHHIEANCGARSYAILYDPLDGSSNTDVNGPLGTVFSIRRRATGHSTDVTDVLRPGTEQVAAGYVLYGPSTQLVYTAGAGVDIFTFDRSLGEFLLWVEGVRMPPRGSAYGVNHGNFSKWHPGARKFVEHITSRKDKTTSYSLRYSGTFVADFHRCLLEGGIFMYPGEVAEGGKCRGKLRLMYELAPMAMIAEQAGGRASTGRGRILDVVPEAIHERQPIYIGGAAEVELAERMRVEG